MKTITYFTSKTCTPCKTLLPKVEEIARKLSEDDPIQIDMYDIDFHSGLAMEVGVMSVPTLLFSNGEPLRYDTPRLTPANARPGNVKKMLEDL